LCLTKAGNWAELDDLLFRGPLPEAGKQSRLWERKGEDTMKLTLATIAGALMFAVCVIASSTPLQQIGQQLESLAH